MKHYLLLMGLILIAFSLTTCKEEETVTEPGQFQIQVDELIQESASGGRIKSTLPAGSSLLISIEDADGNLALNFERVSIITFGGSSVSAPILLKPGNYKLKDFLVVNELDEVLYAIPKSGSEFARLVNRPLPFTFSVWKDRITNISTQVVRATESSPEKFGYVAFNINEAAYPEFRVAVFVPQNGNMVLTKAKAYLIHEGDTIYSKLLASSQINEIIFHGEPGEAYTFMLIKDGYRKYARTFILQDLKTELNGEPLEVYLEPAFTFKNVTYVSEFPDQIVAFYINGDEGKEVLVDWDDGTTTTLSLTPYYSGEGIFKLTHVYQTTSVDVPRHVSITGDIESIRYLNFNYESYNLSFDFRHLKELEHVVIFAQSILESLDFSANKNLEVLSIYQNESLHSVDISQNSKLKFLSISEQLNMTTDEMDQIINDLYENAVANHLMEGRFSLYEATQPSTESLAKLEVLQNEYYWDVSIE